MSSDKHLRAQQQERAKQRQHDLRSTAHSRNLNDDEVHEEATVELLREVTDSDLSPGVVRALKNYVGRDFVLSSQRREDLDEFKWLLRNKLLKATQIHPREESKIDGRRRAVYYDDPKADLEPLSDSDRLQLRSFGDGVRWRAERSEGGEQLRQIFESHSVVESRDVETEDDDSGWFL